MTSRFWAVLVAALATVAPVVGQTTFATFQPKEEALPQPKGEPENPSAKLPDSPAAPMAPETPEKARVASSVTPDFLQAWAPGGDPKWQESCWASADYLMSWFRPVSTPFLVTSSPTGTPQAKAGVLGQTGTTVLFGNETVDSHSLSGFKLAAGSWFTADKTLGFEASFSYLPGQSSQFVANSNGSTILARPFIDANNGNQSSLLVAFPKGSGLTGVKAAGSISIETNTGPFYSGYLDLREVVIRDPGFRLTTLLGYRIVNFSDALRINQTTLPTSVAGGGGPVIANGTQITAQDNFTAQNMFNGCDIGFEAEVIRRNWSLTWVAKVSVGELERDVNIGGATQVSVPGSPISNLQGGLLALSSNSGNHVSTIFSAVPETGVNATWIISDHIRFRVGYSVLLLMNSARAADQVDSTVNPKLINSSLNPPPTTGLIPRPAFSLNPTNMWMQMIDAGLEFRF